MSVHHPYAEGFHKLPLEERNEHFKKEAAKYEDKQRATAEVVQLEPRAAKGSGKRNPYRKSSLLGGSLTATRPAPLCGPVGQMDGLGRHPLER